MSEEIQNLEADLNSLNPLPFPLSVGKASAALHAAVLAMNNRDWIVCGPRFRIAAALRGCPTERLKDPASGAKPYKLAPSTLHPADRALHAVGLAMGSQSPVLCVLGEASIASGHFTEALNVASLNNAPVIFLCFIRDLNGAPVARQSSASPNALAQAYSISTVQTNDIEILSEAISKARNESHPFVIQFDLE